MNAKSRRATPPSPPPSTPATTEPRATASETALRLLVCATALLVPVWVSRTTIDAFRTPKLMLFQSLAALMLAVLAIGAIFHGRRFFAPLLRERRALLVTLAITLWTVVVTLTSTNRPLSVLSLTWVVACAVFFLATLLVAKRGTGMLLLGMALLPAAINGILAVLQRGAIYNPMSFHRALPLRNQATALIGNPNDVGTYLLFPAVIALVLALTSRGHVRAASFVTFAACVAGMIATDTLTSIIAFLAAFAVMLILRSRKAIVPLVALGVAVALLVAAYAPVRARVLRIGNQLREGRYIEVSSMRVPAFMAAWEMFKDHPVTGVGPGGFAYWYLPYKMELNAKHPQFWMTGENFGETHNDHLQTLAVSGLPGYLLLLAATGLLAAGSFRRRPDEAPSGETKAAGEPVTFASRGELSRLASLPLAVAFAVAALAQFPLELAASAHVLLYLTALCVAWREPAA
ncbi:MAG TPA: O-antigen ligase family protein [Thermoanaerobaculia bacterium]